MPDNIKVSEWHEGTFKTARLHDCQNLINYYKRNLKGRSEGRFNYENWYIECKNLRDEGDSKYTDGKGGEREQCEKMEKLIEKFLEQRSPFISYLAGNMGSGKIEYQFNEEYFKDIIELIRKYEQLVKFFNDEHGLSSKNRDDEGEGL